MLFFETLCLWTSLTLYTIAFWINLSGYLVKKEKLITIGWYIAFGAYLFHTVSIITRWMITGHPPVLWTYEHAIASTWFVCFIYFLFSYKSVSLRPLCWLIAFIVTSIQLYGVLMYGTSVEPLPPPYQSNWLWVHVTCAWFSYSSFTFASVVALLYLLKVRKGRVVGDGF